MKKTMYDFQGAIKFAEEWATPSGLSSDLKNAALNLAFLDDNDERVIAKLQCVVVDVCQFLDSIIKKEVEQ